VHPGRCADPHHPQQHAAVLALTFVTTEDEVVLIAQTIAQGS